MCKQRVAAYAIAVFGAMIAGPLPAQVAGQSAGQGRGRGSAPIVEGFPVWLREGVPDFRGGWNSGWIVDMADGRRAEKTVEVPFTEWGRKLWEERSESLPSRHCLPGRYAGSM